VLPPFAAHEHGSDWNDLAKLKDPEDWLRIWQTGVDAARLEMGASRARTNEGRLANAEAPPLSLKSAGTIRKR
jgi:hypothetical protein